MEYNKIPKIIIWDFWITELKINIIENSSFQPFDELARFELGFIWMAQSKTLLFNFFVISLTPNFMHIPKELCLNLVELVIYFQDLCLDALLQADQHTSLISPLEEQSSLRLAWSQSTHPSINKKSIYHQRSVCSSSRCTLKHLYRFRILSLPLHQDETRRI